MKKLLQIIVLLFISVLMSACTTTSTTWVPLVYNKIDTSTKGNVLATVYIRSFGEARYMDVKAITLETLAAITVAAGTMATPSNYQLHNSLENMADGFGGVVENVNTNTIRKNSSEFEKKMGDYNVLSLFKESFDNAKDSLKYFDIEVNYDETEHDLIIKRLLTNRIEDLDSNFTNQLNNDGKRYIAAFKFQYGIGARMGSDQFGFIKKYRPFVRVVGLVKDINTNEFVWGNKILVFSEKVYNGAEQAKNADRQELIQSFEIITNQLTDIIVNDLNGQRYSSEDILVDYNTNDDLL